MKKYLMLVLLLVVPLTMLAPIHNHNIETVYSIAHSFNIKLVNTKLNNPFNIEQNKANNWMGKVYGNTNRFEQFVSVEYGIRAGIVLIKNYNKLGHNSINKIAQRYAPKHENDQAKWINTVSIYAGIPINATFSAKSDTLIRVCKGIMMAESSYR